MREGDQWPVGNCSYRWDCWMLQPGGSRNTSFGCDRVGADVMPERPSERTNGVNCSQLQINIHTPQIEGSSKPDGWAWGTWRLPAAGGEEQMVTTLCPNVLPQLLETPAASGASASVQRAETRSAPREEPLPPSFVERTDLTGPIDQQDYPLP